MNFIKVELEKEFSSVGFKNKRRSLYTYNKQIGKTNKSVDEVRKALAPGKRVSKAGNIYYESRKNRSDKVGSKV